MVKRIQIVSIILVIFTVFGLRSNWASSQSPPQCVVLSQPEWIGTIEGHISADSISVGDGADSHINIEWWGNIHLSVNCETNAVTGTLTYQGNGDAVANIVENGVTVPFIADSCTFSGSQTASGSVSADDNHVPLFDLLLTSTSYTNDCNEDASILPQYIDIFMSMGSGGVLLQASGPEANEHLNGTWRNKAMSPEEGASALSAGGYSVSYNLPWELAVDPYPEITLVEPVLKSYFLYDVPFAIPIHAQVKWHGLDEGDVTIQIGDDPSFPYPPNMENPSSDERNYYYILSITDIEEIGSVGPIIINAKSGEKSAPTISCDPCDITIVPQPRWINQVTGGYTPERVDPNVIYHGEMRYPEEPFGGLVVQLVPDLPIFGTFPYIGGQWGLEPVQFRVGLDATSAGGEYENTISTTGALLLGTRRYPLETSAPIVTNMDADGLTVRSQNFSIRTTPFEFGDQITLLTLIPGVSQLRADSGFLSGVIDVLNSLTAAVTGDVEGRGRVDVTFSGQIGENQNGNLDLLRGAIDSSLTLRASGRFNPLGVAHVAVNGSGTGALRIQLRPEKRLGPCSLDLHFSASAGAAFIGNTEPLETDIHLQSCASIDGTGYEIPHDTQTFYAEWAGENQGIDVAAQTDGENGASLNSENWQDQVVATDVSPDAGPVLAISPMGDQAVVWATDMPSPQIMLRLGDGETWGEPFSLPSNGGLVMTPTAAFDEQNRLVLVWIEGPNGVTPEMTTDYMSQLDVVYAVVDPQTQNIIASGKLTDDGIFDFNPILVKGLEGKLLLTWMSSPSGQLTAYADSPNMIQATWWNDGQWSAVETVTDQAVGTLFYRATVGEGQSAWVALDMDTDGDLMTPFDREIFVVGHDGNGWQGLQQITDNDEVDIAPLLAVNIYNEPVLAWLQNDVLVGTKNDLTTEPRVWFEREDGLGLAVGYGQLVVNDTGNIATLLWPQATIDGQNIAKVEINIVIDTWEGGDVLFEASGLRYGLTAQYTPENDLLVAMLKAPVEEGSSESVDIVVASAEPIGVEEPVVEDETDTADETVSQPTSTGPFDVNAEDFDVCQVFTGADMEGILGQAALSTTPSAREFTTSRTYSCDYEADSQFGPGVVMTISISQYDSVEGTQTSYDAFKPSDSQEIPDLGDEAFWGNVFGRALGIRRGDVFIMVTFFGGDVQVETGVQIGETVLSRLE